MGMHRVWRGRVDLTVRHAAGLPCIAVTTTYTADRLTVANQIVPSLADIDTTALEALVHNSQARREQP